MLGLLLRRCAAPDSTEWRGRDWECQGVVYAQCRVMAACLITVAAGLHCRQHPSPERHPPHGALPVGRARAQQTRCLDLNVYSIATLRGTWRAGMCVRARRFARLQLTGGLGGTGPSDLLLALLVLNLLALLARSGEDLVAEAVGEHLRGKAAEKGECQGRARQTGEPAAASAGCEAARQVDYVCMLPSQTAWDTVCGAEAADRRAHAPPHRPPASGASSRHDFSWMRGTAAQSRRQDPPARAM